ncbi:MAG: heparan-alpha-glucosaminide N-acetyltransferase domain-containing protein [Melioribacteraceae bacterium]|nr:heparan-alpha-glucosaminide N-acetyltransferase domain-containing protein [Melioribacteraceae bacterium]
MSVNSRTRIIFLDMMRALAVLMMVQGHTIDTFLADEYRTMDSMLFSIWYTIRGFTAPIFMFTSGVAFTYLFRSYKEPFFENPRVKKGLLRFVVLVLIGYLLRYPTYTVFNFSVVRTDQWLGFFTVDALHLIGFGLLFVLLLSLIAEKLKIKDYIVFSIGVLFFFGLFSFTEKVNWANYMPIPFAAYLYHGTGSYFPLFPWAGYVIGGALFGSYLAHHPISFTSPKLSVRLFILGFIALAFSQTIELFEKLIYRGEAFWTDNLYVVSMRIGWILILNSIMSYLALKLKSIPEFIKQVGRHTLLVYAVHSIILYGSAWVPGLNLIFARRMDIYGSLISALLMILLMAFMVLGLEKYKMNRKRKLVTSEI